MAAAKKDWAGLKSIAMIESTRTINGKTSKEIRLCISNLPKNAELINSATRSHWGIENSLHWVSKKIKSTF